MLVFQFINLYNIHFLNCIISCFSMKKMRIREVKGCAQVTRARPHSNLGLTETNSVCIPLYGFHVHLNYIRISYKCTKHTCEQTCANIMYLAIQKS